MIWCIQKHLLWLPAVPPPIANDSNTGPGWMLLNYKKLVTVSSTLGAYTANNAVDENIKTYWSASSSDKGEWIQSDLGAVSTIHAVQINYADQDVDHHSSVNRWAFTINTHYTIPPTGKLGTGRQKPEQNRCSAWLYWTGKARTSKVYQTGEHPHANGQIRHKRVEGIWFWKRLQTGYGAEFHCIAHGKG